MKILSFNSLECFSDKKRVTMTKIALMILSIPAVSRVFGHIAQIQHPRILVKFAIKFFARYYQIDMGDYLGNPEDYPSLSAFFVRPLDPSKRDLIPNHSCVLSPADGVISHLQKINKDSGIQVKGWQYKLSELTGKKEIWDKGWWLAVIYLSPSKYHRFHYPVESRLDTLAHLGNRLFPVNHAGVTVIKNLFIRNERITVSFSTPLFHFHLIAVGAALVGNIKMNAHPAKLVPGRTVYKGWQVHQTHEMGRFEMGSTIVLLLPEKMAIPLSKSGHVVTAGEPLFKLSNYCGSHETCF